MQPNQIPKPFSNTPANPTHIMCRIFQMLSLLAILTSTGIIFEYCGFVNYLTYFLQLPLYIFVPGFMLMFPIAAVLIITNIVIATKNKHIAQTKWTKSILEFNILYSFLLPIILSAITLPEMNNVSGNRMTPVETAIRIHIVSICAHILLIAIAQHILHRQKHN